MAYSYVRLYHEEISASHLFGSARTIGEGYDPFRGHIYFYEQEYNDRVEITETYYPLIFVSPYHLSLNMQYRYPDISPVFPFNPSEYSIFSWFFPLYSRYERHYPVVDIEIRDSDEPEHYDAGFTSWVNSTSYGPRWIRDHDYPLEIYRACDRHRIDPNVDLFSSLSVFSSLADRIYSAVYSLLSKQLNLPENNK